MQVELPDAGLQCAVDAARAALLLAADARGPEPGVIGALEQWGFGSEAAAARARHRWRTRLGAVVRVPLRAASSSAGPSHGSVSTLGRVRALLVGDASDGSVSILPELPPEWVGRSVEVHDAPTRAGTVSYAVRWHGDRPALLWEIAGPPPRVCVRAPGLDPAWQSDEPSGDVLLGPVAGLESAG
jgi:hypothetical protein